jgi:4-hydroxy-2-oxoheptanedioate aldolase
VVAALEASRPAYMMFSTSGTEAAVRCSAMPHDGLIVEMEHTSFSAKVLQDYLQYLLDPARIARDGPAPAVTPMVRIPVNGSELNQWMAKQVLDAGAFGVVWPHVDTVEEAANAVAACRYPTPGSSCELGARGCSASAAARYFGLPVAEYYRRAGVWPLDADGEILVVVMIESIRGVDNIERIVGEVPGIGAVFIGHGDLSRTLGCQGRYDDPALRAAMAKVVATCRSAGVACGGVALDVGDAERMLAEGYRLLITGDSPDMADFVRERVAAGALA